MNAYRFLLVFTLLLIPVAAAPSPIVTDRPGFLFSSLNVGRGVIQVELGLPAVTLDEARSANLFALVRYGVTGRFELRIDSPVYNERAGAHSTARGFGDVEVAAKWHLADNAGARPSFALIPSVIVPVGETGFSAGKPIYQLNAMAEWALQSGWGIGALAGYLNGPSGGDRYGQETLGLSLGRSLPSPRWSAYGEAVHVITNLSGASDSSFLGGGIKYLISNDAQFDLSFDRGVTSGSPDWLLGLGFSARF
jgi:hypothetical protein